MLPPPQAAAFIAPLALRALPGVGRKVEQQLQQAFPTIETVGQLRAVPRARLVAECGDRIGECPGALWQNAIGQHAA